MHLSCSLLDGGKCILPESFPDRQMQSLDATFTCLHILVPLGEDVAEFEAVVVLVNSVHYRLKSPRVLHFKNL